MKNALSTTFILLLWTLASCNAVNSIGTQGNDSSLLKENELLKRELSIKQKEAELEIRQK